MERHGGATGAWGASAPPDHSAYLPHVDGLRAVAVALVVLFHAWPALAPGGFIGVDVFFVISGFIITRQLLAEMRAGHFSYAGFLARRARRLVPAALACFAAVTLVAALLYYPAALKEYAKSLLAAAAMVANIFFWRTAGYFDAPSIEKPLLHTWSLAVEDQFYLVWPLVLAFLYSLWARKPRAAVATFVTLTVLSLAHAALAVEKRADYAFYMFPPRAWELLLGCALALTANRLMSLKRWQADALVLAGLAAIVISALWLTDASPFPGLVAVPLCLGAAAVILGGLNASSVASMLLASGPVLLVGQASYSIYLWHWPALVFGRQVLERPPTALEAAVLVGISLAAAFASWAWIEKPFRGARPVLGLASVKRTFALFFASVATVALIAGTMIEGAGWPWRYDAPVREFFAAYQSESPLRDPCNNFENILINDEVCAFGRPRQAGESYDLALIGDSNADHLVPMFSVLAAKAGLSGRQVTHDSCGAILGAARAELKKREEECIVFQRTLISFLDQNPGLKIAVLSSVWSSYSRGLIANGFVPPGGMADATTFSDFMTQTVGLLRRRGIRVVIMKPIPHFPAPRFKLSCFIGEARTGITPEGCGFPVARARVNSDKFQDVFAGLAAADAGVSVFDFADAICTDGTCTGFKDRVFLYRDRLHLNAVGAALLANHVAVPGFE